MQPRRGAKASTYRCRRSLHREAAPNACCSLKNDLRSLLGAIGPYIAEGSGASRLTTLVLRTASYLIAAMFRYQASAGVDILSHKKKASFWRELVKLFPNIIDYLCNPNVDPVSKYE